MAAAGSDDEEETSLLWGHHRVPRQEQKRELTRKRTARRQCIRGGMLVGLTVGLGFGLVCLFPSQSSAESLIGSAPTLMATADHPAPQPSRASDSLIAAATLSSASSTAGVVVGTITKSDHDSRDYRALSLANGMKVLLVSDPTSTSSAAAVDVGVGTWNDPEGLPGLAHFCEHMMFFLNRQKYPRDDEFQSYLSEHGGGTNAFTADTHTNYYFSVQDDALQGALQRYSEFFTAPTFDSRMVDREVNAVNSEHMKNLQSDDWRADQLSRHLSSASHPYHKFGTGSLKTLNAKPGLREALVGWHATRYSANKSSLVIVSPKSLDTLQGYATSLFSGVPSHATAEEPWERAVKAGVLPFSTASLPSAYLVQPVQQLEQLSVTWQLPGQQSASALLDKPAGYVSALLGSEHKGSLLLNLIDRGLAVGLSAGLSTDEKQIGMFSVDFSLTSQGVAQWEKVVEATYAALALISAGGVSQPFSSRLAAESALAFKFKEKESDPSDYASTLASRLRTYAPEKVLSGPLLVEGFSAPSIRAVLSALTPQAMVVMLTSSSLTANLNHTTHLTEPVYGTPYARLPLTTTFLSACAAPAADPTLKLPASSNPFLATDFAMLPATPPPMKAPPPTVSLDTRRAKLWHRTDTSFGMPYASVSMHFTLPPVTQTCRGSALSFIYASLLAEELKPVSNDAQSAQMAVSIDAATTGFELSAYGLSQKLPELVRAAVATFAAVPLKRFDAHKQVLVRALSNSAQTPTPTTYAKDIWSQMSAKYYYSPTEQLDALSASSSADLAAFSAELMNASYLKALVTGNMEEDRATALVQSVASSVGKQPLAAAERPSQAMAKLAGKNLVISMRHPNADETNGAVRLVLSLGKLSAQQAAAAELLADMLDQPFFYELRTVQQLGYIVQSGLSAVRGAYYLVFIVQSETSPVEVTERVHEFINGVAARLGKTDEVTFTSMVTAARQNMLEPPTRLATAASDLWEVISDDTLRFDWTKEVAKALSSTTLPDVLKLWSDCCSLSSGGGRALVQVFAQQHPMATDTTSLAAAAPGGYTRLASPEDFRKTAVYWD